jgi:CRISPR-associated protein Cst2
MIKNMNLKTQGFVLIDVDVVALNNAGKSNTSNFDNAVATKKIYKNGRAYTYVSGQAWRYWWRNTLQNNFGWDLSPVTRDKKIAFTDANPFKFPDDDIFGYMKAAKDILVDAEGNPVLKNNKEQKVDVTVTRVSPLKNSALVSVASNRTVENWSSMARQDGDSVPYSKEEYSAIMKGMFSLDLEQAGTFATYNKTGFKNLTDKLKEEALKENGTEIQNDSFVKDAKGNPQQLVRLAREKRLKRINDTILALKTISGGAMQTNNMADVTPKFIVLATTNSGNHPFSHIVKNDGINNDKALLNIDGLIEVLKDYKDYFQGKIFIGKRNGFMDDYCDKLNEIAMEFKNVEFLTVNEAIDRYCEQLGSQI